MLVLALVLLGDARDSTGTVTADNCDSTVGICSACMTADSSKPYWDGESCVSCAVGTVNARPFLDGDQCVSECSNEQFVSEDDTTCVASCVRGYILVDNYEIVHKKCRQNSGCNYDGGYEYDDPKSKETICVSASVCKNHYNWYAYADAQKCLFVPPKDESEFDSYNEVYTCKENTYIFVGEDSTKCYTKQACPGYVD